MTAEVQAEQLAELVKQVQAGNEVLLTQGSKPVAKLVSAAKMEGVQGGQLRVESIKGHRVLTPSISQSELGEEMFGRE